ncbi:MAG TPA: DoxX family protein [Flavobacterium sp.]|jgi:uncharacterized membrane protein YphA (DoxX/SURF4 family)
MSILSKFDRLHREVKQNRWHRYFAIFIRVGLAWGFLPSGFTKVIGERFTSLSIKHPMGNYLEALSYTGYYYTFIGIAQMTAAVLLLIPRTATLGAMLYFPIILNICILSLAVGFEGSLVTSPLMVFANLYLLCWDYDKLKHVLPIRGEVQNDVPHKAANSTKFPIRFFTAVGITVVVVVLTLRSVYTIMPRNTISDCNLQCEDGADAQVCEDFCDCIHLEGKTFDYCSDQYKRKIKE